MIIRENVPLAPLTTFMVGGCAQQFSEIMTKEDIPPLFQFADEHNLHTFILGGGSNVLVDDAGYKGLVVKMCIDGIMFTDDGDDVLATVGAGVAWDKFVAEAVSHEYGGVENLSVIPGTIGGAVVQNIGAYGCEVSEVIEWVEAYDPVKKLWRVLTRKDCAFQYRDSIFKHEGWNWVIAKAQFRLHKHGTPSIAYKDVTTYFTERNIKTLTPKTVRDAVVAIRTEKFPLLDRCGTAGSFFKNPVVDRAFAEDFIKKYPGASAHDVGGGMMKLSSAWIIDNILHMKGVRRGAVGCWSEQALVIVNYGGATSAEIKNFSDDIQKKCFAATGITLLREVIFVDE